MLLIQQFQSLGYSVQGLKPIASGCVMNDAGILVNEDALNLLSISSIKSPYSLINPIALRRAIAPHIAAYEESAPLTKQIVSDAIVSSININADLYLIEGCGGWTIPLNHHERYSDVITALQLPVIVVVGMRLGCLNHALLTVDQLIQSGVTILGWVANVIDPAFEALDENIQTLEQWLPAPRLATIPYQSRGTHHGIKWQLDSVLSYASCGKSPGTA
jgi:dethiobiotin synthetase